MIQKSIILLEIYARETIRQMDKDGWILQRLYIEVLLIITNNKTQPNISQCRIDKINDITLYKWKIIALSKLFNYI